MANLLDQLKTVTVVESEKAEWPASPPKPNKFKDILLGLVSGLMCGV